MATVLKFIRRYSADVRQRPVHYLIAVFAVGASLGLRFALEPILTEPALFLFIPGVVLSAWIGGLRPGLFATVLSTAAIAYFILEPANSFRVSGEGEDVVLALFALTGGLVSWLFENRLGYMRAQAELNRALAARAQNLQSETADLRTSNQELERFAQTVAHDLNEPLRTVHTYAELVRRRLAGQLDSETNQFIDFILQNAARMQTLTRDLLTYSVEAGQRNLERASVDMNAVVRSAIADLQAAIAESGAVVEYRDLPAVEGELARLVPLLQNLIGNAVKYRGPRPPRIRISAEPSEEGWIFEVGDNGQGFDQQYAKQIFEPFNRLRGREYPGSGLGLAICKNIVAAHGGRIWAESKYGEGSRFFFTLPRAARKPASPEGELRRSSRASGQ